MENYEERYEDVVPYKPYLQDGDKHLVTDRDVTTSYWQAFYGAYADRFPTRNFNYSLAEEEAVVEEAPVEEVEDEDIIVEEVPAEEAPAAAPCCCKKKFKKKVGAMAVALIAAIIAIAVGVVSYFKINVLVPYTSYFYQLGTDVVYNDVIGVISGNIGGMLAHGFVACFLVAGLLTFVSFIVAIAALASKKRVCGVGVLAIIAFVVTLGAGVIFFFQNGVAKDMASIIDYINPMTEGGVQFGLYIGAALLLIEAICGFASYKKVK